MAETLTIEAVGHDGDGIAEFHGRRVYVPFTLPGELVTAQIDGERAELVDILEPSPDRIAPVSPQYGICGGCSVQHWRDEPYQEWKRGLVATAFAQRGIEFDVDPLISVPSHSRRRAVFTLFRTAEGTVLGFNRRASHDVLAIHECPLLVPAIESRIEPLRLLAIKLIEREKRARMIVTAADNGLDVLIEGGKKPTKNLYESLGAEAGHSGVLRLTIDGTEIFMTNWPEIREGDRVLYPTPGGFLQATAPSEAAIAGLVDAAAGSTGPMADLFAGIGTFSLRLAKRAPVLAVEDDADLLAALDRSTRFSTGIQTVTTRRRDLFLNPMAPAELKAYTTVVFDPPRAGAKAQSEMLAKSVVPTVIAVSCNPATLARDARILIDGGYRLTRITPVDQFLWSSHVEVVATFERPQGKATRKKFGVR